MIIKNHTIELNDTSASEMARFRQIMLSIWRQQIEDDRNAAEMEKFVKAKAINNQILNALEEYNEIPKVSIGLESNFKDSNSKAPIPAWKKIMQKYNDWMWWNYTIKFPNNNLQFFPFDARGYELYAHWVIGTGVNLKYNEGHWGDYMRDNYFIEQGLKDVLITKASIMKDEKISNATIERYRFKDGFEIENGYFTGYEMLHGTDKFTIVSGNAKYNKKSDIYTFHLKLQWKDRIDKNAAQGDNDIAAFVKAINLGMAKDYNVEINWSQIIEISTNEVINYSKNNITPEANNRRRR
jgi:hypothetical protein